MKGISWKLPKDKIQKWCGPKVVVGPILKIAMVSSTVLSAAAISISHRVFLGIKRNLMSHRITAIVPIFDVFSICSFCLKFNTISMLVDYVERVRTFYDAA